MPYIIFYDLIETKSEWVPPSENPSVGTLRGMRECRTLAEKDAFVAELEKSDTKNIEVNFKSAIHPKAIEVAVKFWVDALRGEDVPPEHETALQRLGNDSQKPVVSLIDMMHRRLRPSENKLKVFTERLTNLLEDPPRGEWGVYSNSSVKLFVDYNATGLLRVAADAAGISDMAFPFKTEVVVTAHTVAVGWPPRILYETPAHLRNG